MEQWRQGINWFLTETNDIVYGWRLRVLGFWSQGLNRWFLLSVFVLVILLLLLFRRERISRRNASLLSEVSQGVANSASTAHLTSLLFQTLFKVLPAPAACLHLAASPEGPFLLTAKQPNPAHAGPQPDWDPEPLLKSIPKEPGAVKKGALVIYCLPIPVQGQLQALVQLPISTWEEAQKVGKQATRVGSLAAPIVAQLSALERVQRLEERAREASFVSGSSQVLLSTTLGLKQLGELLLDLSTRSTESDAGLVLVQDVTTGQNRIQVLAATGLESAPLRDLAETAQNLEVSFPLGEPRIEQLGSASPFTLLLLQAGFRSAVYVPITIDASPGGSIILLRRRGEFRQNHVRICQMNAARLALSLKNQAYHEAIFGEYKETLKAIVKTLESGSPHLEHHSLRLSWVARDTAEALALTGNEVEGIQLAAELHDVGMVGVDNEVLFKPGGLTNREYDLVKHHPMVGAALTAPIQSPIPIAPIILHHHERYDGLGYPSGLKGSEIPLGSRIIAVGETFDTMVTSRDYRPALAFSDAVARLQALAGRQLDPKIVELFIQKVTVENWQAIARKATY
jgi:response regulator RpfG family c-di-GMP phosphodiesterase